MRLQVVVYTSDVPDGAFDGVVYLTLSGLEGSTQELPLVNSLPNNFGVKAVDTFTIRAGDVGALNSATLRIVRCDPKGCPMACPQVYLNLKYSLST